MAVLQEMADALIAGNANKVKELTEKALAEGIPAGQIIRDGLIPGMAVIGERFKKNEIYVPEVLIAARAMQAGLGIVKPLLSEAEAAEKLGTVCIGTVRGDLHDIGKNLVAMMLEGAGFEVIDLGVDVPPEVCRGCQGAQRQLCGFGTVDDNHGEHEGDHQALTDAGLQDSVKVLVGGAL